MLWNEVGEMTELVFRSIKREPLIGVFKSYPELNSIWKDPNQALAAKEATEEFEDNLEETGNIYLIYAEGKLIGITGYWDIGEGKAGLRWSGLLPTERSNGLGAKIFEQIATTVANEGFTHLYEIAYSPFAVGYFNNLPGWDPVVDTNLAREIRIASGHEKGELYYGTVFVKKLNNKPEEV